MNGTTTLTRAGLAAHVSHQVGLNKQESMRLVDALFEEISAALEEGLDVHLWGFGNFVLRDKPARPGRNPRTGEDTVIRPRRVVTFRPGLELRRRLNADAG